MIDFKKYTGEPPTLEAVLISVENILNIADELGAHWIEIYELNTRPIFYFKKGDERIILTALSGDYFVKYPDGTYGTLDHKVFGERWKAESIGVINNPNQLSNEALTSLRKQLLEKKPDGTYIR